MRRTWVLGLLLIVVGWPASADDAGKLTLTTQKLIVFKDGYCLVIKKAVGTTDADGLLHTEQVPESAVLGTFWATPTEGELVSMKAGLVTTKEKKDQDVECAALAEVIKANEGKAASILLADGTVQQGTIKKVLKGSAVAVQAHYATWTGKLVPATRTAAGVGSSFILSTAVGDVLMPVGQVKRLTIKEMSTTYKRKVTTTKQTKRLTFRFRKPGVKREMSIIYFRPGMRWIPTYRIDLTKNGDKKVADIAMQAEVINEVEDMKKVPLDLVVGVPNFRFKSIPSPLILEHTMRNTIRRAAPQLRAQTFSNAAFRNNDSQWSGRGAAAGSQAVKLPGELTATGKQDLFVYHLPALSFKKGERIAVPVLRTKAEYKDEYTWDIHLKRNNSNNTHNGGSPLKITRNNIWHHVRLANKTKLPWTTGAAMVMQDGQPIAQDMLTYTSAGSSVRVPLTIAVDTRGRYREHETGRIPKHTKWHSYYYSKISMAGTLEVINHKGAPVDLTIVVRVGGKATEASDRGDIKVSPYQRGDWVSYYGIPTANGHSDVTWKMTLKPGESKKLTLKYHFFARH